MNGTPHQRVRAAEIAVFSDDVDLDGISQFEGPWRLLLDVRLGPYPDWSGGWFRVLACSEVFIGESSWRQFPGSAAYSYLGVRDAFVPWGVIIFPSVTSVALIREVIAHLVDECDSRSMGSSETFYRLMERFVVWEDDDFLVTRAHDLADD